MNNVNFMIIGSVLSREWWSVVQCNLRHGSELASPWNYEAPGRGATAVHGERRQLPHTGQRDHHRGVRTMSAVSSSNQGVASGGVYMDIYTGGVTDYCYFHSR